ncbi:anti-sigma-D factor RsdA [Mycobacterium helveticum]|uniref:Anti-sigma-D factor RsdA sigma factor binding region domain-containing protein n=1 Tax=Mycobacterium helveticum TaxID=2592811 RepID=A0A557XY07_9MYCO|nr:anti-sigma-D factor RsdA [Mycobacterium helveticum]TVS87065.1 hypothetical protein FPZ46_09560 [Mycobacterium helveticum]TVS91034.1 hypothetical protein FPZ47_06695 [Mycobacterium helveticum]
MREFGRAPGDQPGPDEFARTDLLLDALAERLPVDLQDREDPDDAALAQLLEDWRDNLRWPPASALVSPEEAVEALRTGIAERRRSRRGLAAIGSVAATLLILSGFGALVAEARPGDALYGLHAMVFDQPRVNDGQITLSAKAELAKIQEMINQGQWDQAQNQLAEVSAAVQSMNDDASRRDLMDRVNLLNAKVRSRDPNATLAPQSGRPGVSPPASGAPDASMAPAPESGASPSPTPFSGPHRHHVQTAVPAPGEPDTP